jgi:hypothetical protein
VGGTQPEIVNIPRTGQRSMKLLPDTELPDCFMGKRKSSDYEIVHKYIDGGCEAQENLMVKNLLRILIRLHSAKTTK